MARSEIRSGHPNGAVRETLLEVATGLFARKGYSATTTREIVAAARVTKPVLYYYFKNKEGIYLEIMERSFKRFEEVVDDSIRASEKIEERVLHLCDQVFGLSLEKIEVVRLMYANYYGVPQGAPFFDFDAVHRRLFEAVKQLVMEGIQRKELKKNDAEDVTWAVLGPLQVVLENELCHPEHELGHAGLRRLLHLIFQGISKEEESGRREVKK